MMTRCLQAAAAAIALCAAALTLPQPACARNGSEPDSSVVGSPVREDSRGKVREALGSGYVTGSLESNSIAYVNDAGIGFRPSDHFGSNDYLKVDYVSGRFSAGIQAEAYLPALQGFDFGPDPKKFENQFDVHNDVLRIADSEYAKGNYTGHDLGFMAQGECRDYASMLKIDSGTVKMENCHLVFFVMSDEDGSLVFANAASSESLDGSLEFEYR